MTAIEAVVEQQLEQKKKKKMMMMKKKKKKKKKTEEKCNFSDPSAPEAAASVPISSPPRKRKSAPGVRVIGGRIYDPEHGKSCHQCRQKTMDFAVPCKNVRDGKPCRIHFCHKCLINRYGEKAEVMAALDAWSCPKCRDICNCSLCMKKRGHRPTGILVHAAKATGFSSVLELLHHTGPKALDAEGTKYSMNGSPIKSPNSQKNLKRKLEKETQVQDAVLNQENGASFGVNVDKQDVHSEPKKKSKGKKVKHVHIIDSEVPHESATEEGNTNKSEKKKKKMKKKKKKKSKKGLDQPSEKNQEMDEKGERTSMDVSEKSTKKLDKNEERTSMDMLEKSTDKIDEKEERTSINVSEKSTKNKKKIAKKKKLPDLNEVAVVAGDTGVSVDFKNFPKVTKLRKKKLPNGNVKEVGVGNVEVIEEASTLLKALKTVNCVSHVDNERNSVDIVLPQGTVLTTVAGIELPAEDVGPALQFLEFCAAFEKVLDLKKDQPESVLKELSHGRIGRRPLNSSIVQFHIKLLSLILKDEGEVSPSSLTSCSQLWLKALKKCITASQCSLKELPLDFFKDGSAGYDNLDFSKKLKMLNFLCDEILTTEAIRNWIDEENAKSVERKREANEEILAAKEKEKLTKQKLKDDVAQAMLSLRNGAPLTITEHDNLVSEIKSKTEEAQNMIRDSKEFSQKRKPRSDAVRTEPILWDECGQAFWRLKAYGDCSHIVLQDIDNSDLITSQDKWFSYDDEQEKLVEKHIFWVRNQRLKLRKRLIRHTSRRKDETVEDTSSLIISAANAN